MNSTDPSPESRFRPRRSPAPIPEEQKPWQYQILDPGGQVIALWNHILLVTCLIALFLDPLYFYLPSVGGPGCMTLDLHLGIVVTFFRSVTDLFYLMHMVIKFRTAFVAPNSRVFGRGELVMDERQIAMRYLKSDFVIDLAATLPLPQHFDLKREGHQTSSCIWPGQRLGHLGDKNVKIVIWFVMPAVRSSTADHTNNTLSLIVLIQYVPRLFLMFPINRRIVKTTGVIAKTAWAGAAYNLLLYMLASHVLGACWYLLAVERQHHCWITECMKETNVLFPACSRLFLDCSSLETAERKAWLNFTSVLTHCDPNNNDFRFPYGMFADAFTNEVAAAKFLDKYLYCLWWGLKHLSSYGQNLTTTTAVGDTSFCILISIVGLVLFSHLIGNMQTYLASMTVRIEEWRVKRRDTEEWMRHRQLPLELQERVHRFDQYKWLATRGVDEESILHSLPLDLRREIQRHLCLALVRRVPFFSQMDGQLLDAICERLVSSLSTQDTYIVCEGDPVNEMLFVIRGTLESSTTNGGRSGFFNSITLRPGDFCGEELLTWALMPNSSLNLPCSTRTVRALSEVEAFTLRAEDLKFVASQFKRLHSKKLQHAFRYYSHQWRTWGACYIQAAWRRFKKRKLAKELVMHESFYYMPFSDQDGNYNDEAPEEDGGAESSSVDNSNNVQHLGATILASRFAKNTRKGANHKVKMDPSAASLKMPKLFKPDEPDFSAD